MKIPESTYNAVMMNALRAFRREQWLLEAADMQEAGVVSTAREAIEGFFYPYANRLLAAASGIPEGREDDARSMLFARFSDLALS